jgi:RNA polymerase sigma factor (sigma-70 family)
MIAAETVSIVRARPRADDLAPLYLNDVFRYVSAFVRPPAEAEDVTMLVFHAAYGSVGRMRSGTDPRLWLLGIARRKVADSLRSRYRRRESGLSSGLPAVGEDVDNAVVVGQVLSQIPADHGEILALKYVNGLSIAEIADVLGKSTAAANSLLQRARESFYVKGAPHFLPQEDQP